MTNGRAPGSGPGANENRNFILFVIIAAAIMLSWEFLYARPMEQRAQAERARVEAQHQQVVAQAPPAPGVVLLARDQALAQTSAQRIRVATDAVDGTILLTGARFDDLNLRGYHETVDPTSPEVTLLQPNDSVHGYDAYLGWQDQANNGAMVVTDTSVWQAAPGQTLTPTTPVVLTYTTPDGLQFTRTYSIDQNYMITSTEVVNNTGAAARTLRPFGLVRRQGLPADFASRNVSQGYAGVIESHLYTKTYAEGQKLATDIDAGKSPANTKLVEAQGHGWLGISDHYWLTALIPDQHEAISANFGAANHEGEPTNFSAGYTGQWRQIAPGQSITYTQRIFSGAKRLELLQSYQHDRAPNATQDGANAITDFDKAIDWGNITWPLSRPFFAMLDFLANKIGAHISATYAFAIGILLTTVVIRLIFFPIMYNSQKSMGKLKILAPKMKEIQERYASDPQKQQQEMMKLYQTEKINPVTGCLPMFLQIPVFFALYKTLSVTIEMRHAPFWGWVHDLSAPDPAMILNLFGLIPWDPHTVPIVGGILGIGIWPILYGVSMMAQQALSPPPPDPTQAQIFRLMPIMFTLMLAGLPAGLLIYYTWSYSLLILQQYVILRRQGVETPFDQFMKKRFGGAAMAKADGA